MAEYNRFLLTWGDHTSMLSSGYLLYTVKVIYSDDIFYTDKEMREIFGKSIDVQSKVEQPEIFIVGQCKDNTEEKLTYVESRLEGMEKMAEPLKIGDVVVKDNMRFFIGKEIFLQCSCTSEIF